MTDSILRLIELSGIAFVALTTYVGDVFVTFQALIDVPLWRDFGVYVVPVIVVYVFWMSWQIARMQR